MSRPMRHAGIIFGRALAVNSLGTSDCSIRWDQLGHNLPYLGARIECNI
jgi:hypothetical protein